MRKGREVMRKIEEGMRNGGKEEIRKGREDEERRSVPMGAFTQT